MTYLLGSLILRPYVYLFLLVFLVAAVRDLGVRRTLTFVAWVWPCAFVAEFASTRIGLPFGLYHYTQATRGQELFLADVPFFDSLSFTFLAYAAFCLARVVLGRRGGTPALAVLAGVLMMLLDVVIDPLAVRGDRWFLGRVFWYPNGGWYFGVPLSNFAGWVAVGVAGVGGYLGLTGRVADGRPRAGVALYYAVLAFNLVVTAWIGEPRLVLAGVAVHTVVGFASWMVCHAGGAPSRVGPRGVQRA